jgi:signal peptidase I
MRMTDTHEAAAAAPARRRRGGPARFLRDIVVIFVVALLLSFVIKTFVVRSFYIPSGSMENTLQINDRIIVNELVPRFTPIKRGDVVVFKDPGSWLESAPQPSTTTGNPVVDGVQWFLTQVGIGTQDSNQYLIKRVIGLPGDTVSCCDAHGHVEVNGKPITEPYIVTPAGRNAVPTSFSVTVPAGALWVLGDNRYNSADSAYHYNGKKSPWFVPISDVDGRAVLITWPVQHWSFLDDFPSVFRGSDRAGS